MDDGLFVSVWFAGDMARGCGGKQACFGRLGTAHPLAPDCLTGEFIGQETARTQCQCECKYIAVLVLLQLVGLQGCTVCT
jgi:hypothetical protein